GKGRAHTYTRRAVALGNLAAASALDDHLWVLNPVRKGHCRAHYQQQNQSTHLRDLHCNFPFSPKEFRLGNLPPAFGEWAESSSFEWLGQAEIGTLRKKFLENRQTVAHSANQFTFTRA